MSDEEISRDPETRGSKARSSTDSSFSPKDAVALFFQQLDSALESTNKLFAEIDVKIGLQNIDEVNRSTFMH
jgi:hypothetical protein